MASAPAMERLTGEAYVEQVLIEGVVTCRILSLVMVKRPGPK